MTGVQTCALPILACWIGIQRLAGRLPVEPMGTPTEMILDVERSQTDIPMIGMEPTAVVNHQGKGTSVQSGTVFPSEFIPIAMPETEPAVVQGLTLIEPQQEIIETQSPERKMATHTAIAEQKKSGALRNGNRVQSAVNRNETRLPDSS